MTRTVLDARELDERRNESRVFYPRAFPDVSHPLGSGTYEVRWFARHGVGQVVLARTSFEVADGEVTCEKSDEEAEEGLPNWEVGIHEWPTTDFGGPGVMLWARSTDGDQRSAASCLVSTPDGREYSTSFTIFVPKHQQLPREAYQFIFPRDFKDAPDPPFLEGRYPVAWWVEEGVSKILLKRDCFRVHAGKLKTCEGAQVKSALDFESQDE